jgi:two-component system sensor histidine kinase/response regulator
MSTEPVRVLLIEDNPGDARLVEAALAKSRNPSFQVQTAETMASALELLGASHFDALLVDLGLPDCSQHDAIPRITSAAPQVPIVVLSGLDDEQFSRELVKLGAQDYLVKGQFDGRLLARALSYAIERKRTQRELAAARDQALEASKHKSSFLAAMSHEIRTPMNAIIGMTEMLLTTELDAEQREFADTVNEGSQALLTIINDILDLSKVSAGKLTLHDAEFSPAKSVEGVIEMFTGRVRPLDVRLVSLVDGGVPTMLIGDAGRLRQVLINLVGNAVKFTERGEIVVEVRKVEEIDDEVKLNFAVSDTGPGIPAAAVEHLFDAFYQSDSEAVRRQSGTGLGLFIAAQIVELMEGKISVESVLGKGSSFRFDARFRKLAGGLETEMHAHAGFSGKRVLIVDPDVSAAQWMCRQIRAWGLQCATAHTQAEVLAILNKTSTNAQRADFAVIDLDSSELNGLEISKAIHQNPDWQSTRLIATLNSGRRPDIAALKAAGFHSWTSKPFRQSPFFNLLADPSSKFPEAPSAAIESPRSATATIVRPQSDSNKVVQKNRRILVVEDLEVNQRIIIKMLGRLGYQADLAWNGVEAIDALRAAPYDLILMDCQMPEMDGYDATRAIRRMFPGRRPVIIGLTASAISGDRERCLEAGMDDYLSKPIMMNLLETMLEERFKPEQQLTPATCAPIIAASPLPTDSAIDEPTMSKLEEIGDAGSNFVSELTEVFLGDLVSRIDAINLQLKQDDKRGMSASAHAIKGSCGHFGSKRLMELCAAIEAQVRDGLSESMESSVKAMIAEAVRVREALLEYQRAKSERAYNLEPGTAKVESILN